MMYKLLYDRILGFKDGTAVPYQKGTLLTKAQYDSLQEHFKGIEGLFSSEKAQVAPKAANVFTDGKGGAAAKI